MVGIAAFCAAPIHGVYRKSYTYIIVTVISINISIIIGTTISQLPLLVPYVTFIIGALTFYLPTKFKLMPEILTKFCFIGYISSTFGHSRLNLSVIITSATIITIILIFYYALINILLYRDQPHSKREKVQDIYHHVMIVALVSLVAGYFVTKIMTLYIPNTNPWWIMMTIVLVLGYTYQRVKVYAFKRGIANILGPIIMAILMTLFKNHYYLQVLLVFVLFFLVNCSISYYLILSLFASCMIISWEMISLSPPDLYTIALDRALETLIAVGIVLTVNEIYKRIFANYINKRIVR